MIGGCGSATRSLDLWRHAVKGHHGDRGTAEHDAHPGEGAVGQFTRKLVHAVGQHGKEDPDEHHHERDDFVFVLLGVESCREMHQGCRHR